MRYCSTKRGNVNNHNSRLLLQINIKNPRKPKFPGIIRTIYTVDQRLLNWGARRAAFRPRKLHIPRIRVSRMLTHFAAPPLPTKPAALGFGGGPIQHGLKAAKKERHPFGWRSCITTTRSGVNQRLENWGARRAAFRPYFLRSFIRGSRVRKPAAFRAARLFSSASSRARATP